MVCLPARRCNLFSGTRFFEGRLGLLLKKRAWSITSSQLEETKCRNPSHGIKMSDRASAGTGDDGTGGSSIA